MGQGAAEAQRERELSKQALAARVSALEARVRASLDWRARLRRDGLRYLVIGTAVVVVAGTVIVMRLRRPHRQEAEVAVSSLDDIATQLAEIRTELARRRRASGPLWRALATRATAAAAAGAGGVVARRVMERYEGGETGEGGEGAGAPPGG
jgi:hypothetical protein